MDKALIGRKDKDTYFTNFSGSQLRRQSNNGGINRRSVALWVRKAVGIETETVAIKS